MDQASGSVAYANHRRLRISAVDSLTNNDWSLIQQNSGSVAYANHRMISDASVISDWSNFWCSGSVTYANHRRSLISHRWLIKYLVVLPTQTTVDIWSINWWSVTDQVSGSVAYACCRRDLIIRWSVVDHWFIKSHCMGDKALHWGMILQWSVVDHWFVSSRCMGDWGPYGEIRLIGDRWLITDSSHLVVRVIEVRAVRFDSSVINLRKKMLPDFQRQIFIENSIFEFRSESWTN